MAKKLINKISDKLTTVNENFTVTMYDNGFLIDIGGKRNDDDWATAKIMVPTVEKLLELVQEAANMPRDGEDEE
jgi:hypothetical protein